MDGANKTKKPINKRDKMRCELNFYKSGSIRKKKEKM